MTTKEIKERTAEDIAAAAPVSLPAGSYDVEALGKALDKAAEGAPEKRHDAVTAAVQDLNEGQHSQIDPGLEPGFKYQAVEREDLGVTEVIQVRDKAETKALEKEQTEAEKAAKAEAARLQDEADARNKVAEEAAAAANNPAATAGEGNKTAGAAGGGKE